MALPSDYTKWSDSVKVLEDWYSNPTSAKNVEHVLSKSLTRAPQKLLCSCIEPFTEKLINCGPGVSILTSLVLYGTTRTVNLICERLLKADEKIWTFQEFPTDLKLVTHLSKLLEGIAYREDCTEPGCTKIFNSLTTVPSKKLFSENFTLPAAGYLLSRNPKLLKEVEKDKASQKVLQSSMMSVETRRNAQKMLEVLLQNSTKGDTDEATSTSGQNFVGTVIVPLLKSSSTVGTEFLMKLVSSGSTVVVDTVSKNISKWSDVHELTAKESYCNIFSVCIEKTTDEASACELVRQILRSKEDIQKLLNCRKAPPLKLLTSIYCNKSCLAVVTKKFGVGEEAVLRAAKVKYINATQAKPENTRKSVLEKINALSGNSTSTTSRKRTRDVV